MSNRYLQQFLNHLVHNGTWITGQINLVQEVKATLTLGGVTYTAANFGTGGNAITVAYTTGGTAGSEVVTVTGNAISVQIQSGTSTITQVRTAVNASGPAAALVAATGTSATVVTAPAGPTALSGGIDGVASETIIGASAAQTGVGEITVTLDDSYQALTDCNATLLMATAQDLIPQIKSNDVVTAKTIVIRLLTGATPTDPTSAASLQFSAFLRASSVPV